MTALASCHTCSTTPTRRGLCGRPTSLESAASRCATHYSASTSECVAKSTAASRRQPTWTPRRGVATKALFDPPPFKPEKLAVLLAAGTSSLEPAPPRSRKYTLTHNDITGNLRLTIGADYNQQQISGFYTRLLRDEVIAEWVAVGASGYALHVYCHVSGEERWLAPPLLRNYIFRREMPLVLDTIVYADRQLLQRQPELARAQVYIHFQSSVRAPIRSLTRWSTGGCWASAPRGPRAPPPSCCAPFTPSSAGRPTWRRSPPTCPSTCPTRSETWRRRCAGSSSSASRGPGRRASDRKGGRRRGRRDGRKGGRRRGRRDGRKDGRRRGRRGGRTGGRRGGRRWSSCCGRSGAKRSGGGRRGSGTARRSGRGSGSLRPQWRVRRRSREPRPLYQSWSLRRTSSNRSRGFLEQRRMRGKSGNGRQRHMERRLCKLPLQPRRRGHTRTTELLHRSRRRVRQGHRRVRRQGVGRGAALPTAPACCAGAAQVAAVAVAATAYCQRLRRPR
eukprot:XP_001690907.1 predicted protein [Chlamydomonas reinhardtii]